MKPFEPLESERLIIRRWQDEDRELFHRVYSDEAVMRFFPYRRNRQQSDQQMDLFNQLIDKNGFSFSALQLKSTGKSIGIFGLSKVNLPDIFPDGGVEIGWRLAPEYWGKGYATEAGFRMLDFGFKDLKLNKIVSFAVKQNLPSIAVMRRLGMVANPEKDFNHPGVPDTHPDLVRHVYHSISRDQWHNHRAEHKSPSDSSSV